MMILFAMNPKCSNRQILDFTKIRTETNKLWVIIMENITERRREKRLRYNWPVWYAGKEDIDETVLPGRMVNVSSGGAAFTCSSEEDCPHLDQWLTTHFSVPHSCPDGSFDMEGITRVSKVCRIDRVDNELRRIAIQFVEPLPFKPGEQESK